MARYKSLLLGWQVVNAGRARKCYHSPKHQVQMGDCVLEVSVGMAKHGYCLDCARQMADAAAAELQQLGNELEVSRTS